MSAEALQCPVCQNFSYPLYPVPGWGEMRRCRNCGLSFANPMLLPLSPKELFSQAYAGKTQYPSLKDYDRRMKQRNLLLGCPNLLQREHTFALCLDWLKQNLPGSLVLDVGCGPGYLLHALRREGFQPIGIEPGELPVRTLQEEGFQVWQGTMDDYPPSWPRPQAVTCMYMLHHLAAPLDFLRTLHHRFPIPLLVGQYHSIPDRKGRLGSIPPRALTYWTPRAVEEALTRAGYRASVSPLPIVAGEYAIPLVYRVVEYLGYSPFLKPLLPLYSLAHQAVFSPIISWKRLRGVEDSFHIFAVGLP